MQTNIHMQANNLYKIKAYVLFACIYLFMYIKGYAQIDHTFNPALLHNTWNAEWLSYPGVSLKEYGVFHFRKTIKLDKKPGKFILHVSGDNRYKLFVNGEEVCHGPARGDLMHWRFETVDIAGQLTSGENVVAAVVWNFGSYAPLAQISGKTAFIVQGDTDAEAAVNTNKSWKVYKNDAYTTPLSKSQFTVVGPGDRVDGSKYPYGWEKLEFNDANWKTPLSLGRGTPYGKTEGGNWQLVQRNIPFMEHTLQRISEVERTEGIKMENKSLSGKSPLIIPAHRSVKILLDQTYLTTAYPEMVVTGGKDAVITINYAEALTDPDGKKGNRDSTRGKSLIADNADVFMPDGGNNRHFGTLWFRTFRYMELAIKTKDDPLVLNDLYGWFTAYPFKENASFKSDDGSLKQVWDTGWRTARLCAAETYYDCPYYEQLQYIGDTRIQALISLYVSGDDRLMRNAIQQFQQSILPIGLTQSRYPTAETQIIPPFSLYWIAMVHDYWMHREDEQFINGKLDGIQSVLSWYQRQIAANGMLGPMDWWNFVDWSFGPWDGSKPVGGTPPGAMDGHSAILSLQYVYALQMAADLFEDNKRVTQATAYRQLASSLLERTKSLCWNPSRELLSDTPEQNTYSQHANILAVLTGMFKPEEEKVLIRKVLQEPGITEATLYFKFYLVQAMEKAGLADEYISQLKPWKDMLKLGLTTLAETPEPTRSDCHAWSASPNYDLLATVCGIRPASPGFKTVKVEPQFGPLKMLEARMPHPKGTIYLSLKKNNKRLTGTITLPQGLSGELVWNKQQIALHPGKQVINL
ncbi:alpha-L-rhamnosidase-related protein [Desertivirga xinjiangensis]|uniref:alpha-L-rhamnosidase-related protein n=1 Tax=Desertivirga xinjiangensis TaxID=539206 RepID=UPI002109DA97|nr:alpha-L-rhamnosidase C-terminal domain-containing protein [Pedobacter xinjiangensis]